MGKIGGGSVSDKVGAPSLERDLARYAKATLLERKEMLSDPGCPAELILRELRTGHSGLLSAVLRSSHCPVARLEECADSENEWIRAAVASNPQTPRHVLDRCRDDSQWWVRASLAGNPSATADDCAALAGDASEDVRLHVAQSPAASLDTLVRLLAYPETHVHLAAHENADGDLLRNVVESGSRGVREALANPTCPPDILEGYASDGDDFLRVAVAANPSTPAIVLEKLAADSQNNVRATVFANPAASDTARATAQLIGFEQPPSDGGSP